MQVSSASNASSAVGDLYKAAAASATNKAAAPAAAAVDNDGDNDGSSGLDVQA